MTQKAPSLRQLLADLLPLRLVGPDLRRRARRALETGDQARLLSAAHAVVAELLRRGDLVRVVAHPSSPTAGPLGMLREGARLVDLSALNPSAVRSTPRRFRAEPAAPGQPPLPRGADRLAPARLCSFTLMLAAMEKAQNLRVGDPQSGEREVILDGILALLSHFVQNIQLSILLHGEGPTGWRSDRIHYTQTGRPLPQWVTSRAPGSKFWIPSWIELPDDVKLTIVKGTRDQLADNDEVAAHFEGGIAVPLYEPNQESAGRGRGGAEAGLLFVLPRQPWRHEDLFRIGRRLSSFVTRRWHHQRDVNQRIHSDSLTNAYNRAFFDLQFPMELERARRDKTALSLVLGDLDHFKQVNDRHGHQAGDIVLKEVARELQHAVRRIDYVCRIGGEEFALILPNTPAAAAHEVLGRLLARFAQLAVRIPDKETPLGATLSFGAVTFPDGGSDADELYRKADSMLYMSKATGRNKCHYWNPTGEPLIILPPPPES